MAMAGTVTKNPVMNRTLSQFFIASGQSWGPDHDTDPPRSQNTLTGRRSAKEQSPSMSLTGAGADRFVAAGQRPSTAALKRSRRAAGEYGMRGASASSRVTLISTKCGPSAVRAEPSAPSSSPAVVTAATVR